MSLTLEQAIEQVRFALRSTFKDIVNTLAVDIDANDAEIELTESLQGQALSMGITLSIGMEDSLVIAPAIGQDVRISRAHNGTTAESHVAGELVRVRPRYSPGMILAAMQMEIRSWVPELWRREVLTDGLSTVSGTGTYDLGLTYGIDLVDVLSVWVPRDAASTYVHHRPITNWEVMPIGPVDICPDGTAALAIDMWSASIRSLHVIYACPIDAEELTVGIDLESSLGIHPTMIEVLTLGAAKRLLIEAPRTDQTSQRQPGDNEDVPAGLITSVRRDIEGQYNERRQAAIMALRRVR